MSDRVTHASSRQACTCSPYMAIPANRHQKLGRPEHRLAMSESSLDVLSDFLVEEGGVIGDMSTLRRSRPPSFTQTPPEGVGRCIAGLDTAPRIFAAAIIPPHSSSSGCSSMHGAEMRDVE